MNLTIAFRVDASLEMGTGHVMRCLSLADALKKRGAVCHFICREHKGNLIEHIRNKGFFIHALPISQENNISDMNSLDHAHWLGASQIEDAKQCSVILKELDVTWMIVDHYGLDQTWEQGLKSYYRKLMVIDDLADRMHDCELLLDQTFGRKKEDYRSLITRSCLLLCGSKYAMLRPEFAKLRAYSLQRRENPQLQKILITLGGVDKDNITSQILESFQFCNLPKYCEITVIMGATAPWIHEVVNVARILPWKTEVKVNVCNMAELMADSDLCIGAAGATSWERCCLGLPSIMLVLADNQLQVARALDDKGAACAINKDTTINVQLPNVIDELINGPYLLYHMSQVASSIVDGKGVSSVVSLMDRKHG